MRLVFMGTPDFAACILEALLGAGHEVVCVYSQPPRPAGRGHKEQPSPVHALARSRGIEVRTPARLKAAEEHEAFAALGADVAVVAAYGLLLPRPVLEAPRLGCVNVHASLLPRWRGAAPIQRAIEAGDAESGVTIMRMDEGLDTGPMLLRRALPLPPDATAPWLHDRLAEMGAAALLEALTALEHGPLPGTPQPAEGVTYAAKLARDEGRVDWSRPAVEIERQVRALNPWPGVWFEHQGERIKLLAAALADGAGPPGRVLDEQLAVACGAGALRALRLQRPGRAPMAAGDLLRGFAIPPGVDLG